jgi:hypothetical protein
MLKVIAWGFIFLSFFVSAKDYSKLYEKLD